MNEGEALPLWKLFEDATGVKVSYVRSSDTQIMAKVAIENRARQRTWDIAFTTTVGRISAAQSRAVRPAEAKGLMPEARDPTGAGTAATPITMRRPTTPISSSRRTCRKPTTSSPRTRNGPARSPSTTPTTNGSARSAPLRRGARQTLVQDIVANLKPIITDGHLALARSVGAGEYWLSLNNYVPLTLNVKMAGGPIDFWPLDPVALIFGSVGVNTLAPHPNAAKLAGNFVLSQEGETFMTIKGRLPTRPDVATNPPDVGAMLKERKIMPVVFSGDDQKKWQKTYNELFGRH